MDTFNYELAQKFCKRALEVDSNHLELLETAGAVFLETGEVEKAKNVSLNIKQNKFRQCWSAVFITCDNYRGTTEGF